MKLHVMTEVEFDNPPSFDDGTLTYIAEQTADAVGAILIFLKPPAKPTGVYGVKSEAVVTDE